MIREAQRDYKAERMEWERAGRELRAQRARERAAEEADQRRQQREQENIRLRASLDGKDKTDPYAQGYRYRKGQLDAETEADRSRAVERFVRLEASRTQPGSGLGLSLASAVATLHGGALRLADGHPGLRATLVIPSRSVEPKAA